MDREKGGEGPHNASLALIAFGVAIALLVYGRSFLIPLAIAILAWNVLGAIIEGFARLRVGSFLPPFWLAAVLGVAATVLGAYLIMSILLGQVDALSAAWPRYATRLETMVGDLTEWLGPDLSAKLKAALSKIDLTARIPGLISSTQSMVFTLLLVIAYVGFLAAERGQVSAKLAAMFPDAGKAHEAATLLSSISDSVRRYIWIKTIVSVLTAVTCYVVLRWLGVDFAETWALLIFVLNFIPNIGSIIAVAFPALLALVQFETLTPFVVLVVTLTAIQMAIGSVLEPLLMGSSLNISPLAIIVGLAFWGAIWGVVGAFLSVPILVVTMIVCAKIPRWRWVAILLSKDGRIEA